jgi:hypothetical protein
LRDYSVFLGGGAGASPILKTTGFGPAPLLGTQFDHANPGFATLFPALSLPGLTTPAGSAGHRWVGVEVRRESNLVTWLLNGTLVAQYTNTTSFTNGTFMIGYNDNFGGSIGNTANFALLDNLRVETIGLDYDNDGLLDSWEVLYFGSLDADPNDDSDGDGLSDGSEFFAGTNPTNSLSVLKMTAVSAVGPDVEISFSSVGGRSYVVQRAAGPELTFNDQSGVITANGAGEGVLTYTNLNAGTNGTGYYRVRLEP